MKAKPIYVETYIKCSFEKLWEYTQTPELHQKWDLRFTEIKYLPKEDSVQKFLYTTKIGFGLKISGSGESTGNINKENGESISALKFWSDEIISLIKTGSGYWKYIPDQNGVKFFTWYDYKTRFGIFGKIIDLIFRPLIGWATAWSFDCLRLWLERGIDPAASVNRLIIQIISRGSLAVIWIYQGLIPKILFKDSGELEILKGANLFSGYENKLLTLIGLAEIIFGLLFIFNKNIRIIYFLNILGLIVLGLGALFSQPKIFIAPFNPLTLSLAMIALSINGIISLKDLPKAGNCRREKEI